MAGESGSEYPGLHAQRQRPTIRRRDHWQVIHQSHIPEVGKSPVNFHMGITAYGEPR